MILLHRPEQPDPLSDQIEQRLKEMVISHKIHRYPAKANQELPYLQENDHLVTGKQQINQFLRELETELREQRMVSGDSCYIDPQTGEIC
ncbi:hypothetical protein ACG2F4_00790 [Halalkalibaculum sp. DA3122]|uniref:hypothetical protein n=1 Tax=unclassified Halalkalibaculum TaxID=2964617 RepID=UPI0037544D00